MIEMVPGKMSGAPVLRYSRVRPQDLVANIDEGENWLRDAYGLPLDDVRAVLAFYEANQDELPLEYIAPERIAALGADGIDWSECPLVDERSGRFVIRDTVVRPLDLIANADAGAEGLAYTYSQPSDTVQAVLRFYHAYKRHLAHAV